MSLGSEKGLFLPEPVGVGEERRDAHVTIALPTAGTEGKLPHLSTGLWPG